MKTTFVALVGLCAASLVVACDDDKKPTETMPSATATVSGAAAPAAATPKPTPAEVIPKTVKAAVDGWNAHDAAKVAASYEPTGKLVIPGMPDITGKDGLMAEEKADFTAYSDFKVAVTRGFIKGNTAVFEWVITGKNDGPMMGKPASGRPMGVAGASVATFDDDGLIKEEHRYVDLLTIMNQLDAKAKAGSFRAPMTLPTGSTEWHVAKGTADEAKTVDQGNAILKADASKDEKTFMATVTDDYVWDDFTNPAPLKTADLPATMARYAKSCPDYTLPTTMTLGVDGYFVAEVALTGTQTGPMGTIKASNKAVRWRFLDIQLLKDGKASKATAPTGSSRSARCPPCRRRPPA
jgi:steroid delta-isomerase-like uncharacterized protein